MVLSGRFTTTILILLLAQGCGKNGSPEQPSTGQAQTNENDINFVAVVGTHTITGRSTTSLSEARTGISVMLYQLDTPSSSNTLLEQHLSLPKNGCQIIRSETRTVPWLYNDMPLTSATPISVGPSIEVMKSSTLTATSLSELAHGEYGYSSGFEYLIDDGQPISLSLPGSHFKASLESEYYPVKRSFEWMLVTSFGEFVDYTNGYRPDTYSLDFSLRWPIVEQEDDSIFIKAWAELDTGAEIAVYCLVDETGDFSIPIDTQEEIASLGLDGFQKIYISRLTIESNVIDDVLIVKTAETTRGTSGGDLPTHLLTDVIQ